MEMLFRYEPLVPLAGEMPAPSPKSVKEIRLLDPATGTMHFGLVAFDLLATMYQEEMAHAGERGWPAEPPVSSNDEIPGAILSNNLFGIDIDLRAVQLSALALYLRAKSFAKDPVLTETNLACADVAIFRGSHRSQIAGEMELPGDVTRQLFEQFCDSLDDASMLGSLVRLEELFERKLRADELKKTIDTYVEKKRDDGIDETYFGGETIKGLRLLNVLSQRYDVVVTNPPYMSSRNMEATMGAFMRRNYKSGKGDLYAAFIERCTELLAPDGRVGMITQQSFMYIPSYEKLRKKLLDAVAIESMVHVGPRAFDEVKGEKVNTTAFVLRQETFSNLRNDSVGVYFRLVNEVDSEAKRSALQEALDRRRNVQPHSYTFEYQQIGFGVIPGNPWVYQSTEAIRGLFRDLPLLKTRASARQGLATSDNGRFIRYWWEVGAANIAFDCGSRRDFACSAKKWAPHMKGGSQMRWLANKRNVINWDSDGAELMALQPRSVLRNPSYYFREGVTYSAVSSGRFRAMYLPKGFIFDSASDCVYPDERSAVLQTLSLLNSNLAGSILTMINPTVNVYTSDLDRLPFKDADNPVLRELAADCVAAATEFELEDENSYSFVCPAPWPDGNSVITSRWARVRALESQLDEEVYRLYDISVEDQTAVEQERVLSIDSKNSDESDGENLDDEDTVFGEQLSVQELASHWVAYAVGVALGRFYPGVTNGLGKGQFEPKVAARLRELADADGLMVLEEGHPDDLTQRTTEILSLIHEDREAERILYLAMRSNGSPRNALAKYLLGPFFRDHAKLYSKRPVYWLIQSPKKMYNLYLFHERATGDTLSLIRGNRYLGGRINRLEQDYRTLVEAQATRKAGEIAEELEDLREFDRLLEASTRVPAKDKDGRGCRAIASGPTKCDCNSACWPITWATCGGGWGCRTGSRAGR